MRIVTSIVRYLVGGLFIFSGLIKVNDPVGTAIKMEEYFAVFAGDIASFFIVFEPYALIIAVIMNVLEVVLGLALIIRWRVKFTLGMLTGLIVFFTFLTFYTAYFNKVTDCGCFGDAIKLTPWESFTKDVILVVMIGFLLFRRNKIAESTFATKGIIIGCTTIVTTLLCLYAIKHLPYIDFRAYKVGTTIQEAMSPAESPKFQYTFLKNGEEIKSFTYLSEKDGYELVGHEIINEEASTPKITDFALWNESGDKTEQVLEGTKLLVVTYFIEEADENGLIDIKNLLDKLSGEVKPLILTSSAAKEVLKVKARRGLKPDFYYGDATVLKTIIRSNPGLVLLKNGTVLGKWHYNDVPEITEINELLK